MEYIKVNDKCYEVLEKGDLDGNISHLRLPNGLIVDVISGGHGDWRLGDRYYMFQYSDGVRDHYFEKEFWTNDVLPLRLIVPEEEVIEEVVTEPDFISARVVGVREYDDDNSIVEMKVQI